MEELKHVKVFESFEDEETKPELRPGQKAAVSRGDDILSEGQYAACYLNAIQALGRAEDTRGRGDTGLTRNALKMVGQEQEDWQKISAAKLSIYLNLKPQTVERTVSKFKLLLQGEREGSESNVLWPELIATFDWFESMPKAEVLALAEEAIDQEADDSQYQEYLAKMSAQSKKSRDKKLASDEKVRKQIRSTFNSLKDQYKGDLDKAVRNTMMALARSFDTTEDDIRTQAKIEFKKEPNLLKVWTPKRFQ